MRQKFLSFICMFITVFIFSIQCSNTGSNIKTNVVPDVRLSINTLISQGIKKNIAADLTMNLYKSLKKLKGERILYRKVDGVNKSANRQLTGSVSKLGKSYILTIKIVEGEKGKLLFNKTIMSKSINDLNSTVEDIAEDISDNEEIW